MRNVFDRKNWTAVITAVFFSFCLVQCAKDDTANDPTPTTPVSPKARFIGDWSCSEVSHIDPPAGIFQVHILNAPGDSLIMENCYAGGFAYKSKLVVYGDSLKFTPNNQQVGSGIFLLKGEGKLINTSTITMTYLIDDASGVIDTIDATFTK